MDDDKRTGTSLATEGAGHNNWERVVLGQNGISGTLRMIVYIGAFALIFGSLFYFVR